MLLMQGDIYGTLIFYGDAAARILLACVLGGIIGYEREHTNRPAGFRTHILVCAGAALVMLTGEFIHLKFGGGTDPARIGAQVVSGIGFLGAGTILRSGFHVKGLTTAASLWAVSCVGLACGIGFYAGAVIAAVAISTTLVYLKKFEKKMWSASSYRSVSIRTKDLKTAMIELNEMFKKYDIDIRNTEFLGEDANHVLSMQFIVKTRGTPITDLYDKLLQIPQVEDVQIK